MSEPIDIPVSAFEPKPLFPDFPVREVVEEIRDWVKLEPTWSWRGHSHSKPTAEESRELRYVADFQLPKGTEAPCPCCTPTHPKFGTGYIAWFPRTSCIRLMGRDCFRKLNPDSHNAAVSELRERMNREAAIAYLSKNVDMRFDALRAIEGALPIAEHLDDLQDIFGEKLKRTIGIDLWQHVRDGQLKIVTQTRQGPVFAGYASIAGISLVDPARKKIAPSLRTAARALEKIDLPMGIVNTNDEQRAVAARHLTRGFSVGKSAFDAINDAKAFISVTTIATLRNWGNRADAPMSLYVSRDGLEIQIGKTHQSVRRITLDNCVDTPVPKFPELTL